MTAITDHSWLHRYFSCLNQKMSSLVLSQCLNSLEFYSHNTYMIIFGMSIYLRLHHMFFLERESFVTLVWAHSATHAHSRSLYIRATNHSLRKEDEVHNRSPHAHIFTIKTSSEYTCFGNCHCFYFIALRKNIGKVQLSDVEYT